MDEMEDGLSDLELVTFMERYEGILFLLFAYYIYRSATIAKM